MSRKKKEFIVHTDSQTFLIREGESRRVNMPVMLSMKNGVLNIGYPDNYWEEYNEAGAPAPTFEELKSGREYEKGRGDR